MQPEESLLGAVMMLAETLDGRDPAHQHSRMVGDYSRNTASLLGLPAERIDRIESAGVLHDLGKIGISDSVLFKPGRLDKSEWLEVQRHPEIGARILEHAGIEDIASWVIAHHEWMDGHGYPRMLRGAEIPLEARILAVGDAYEAMIIERPYSPAMLPAYAQEQLRLGSGTQFDPDVVNAFLAALPAEERGL